ncbi:GNAT family N-acetyltransferase [Deferrisoma sp.]
MRARPYCPARRGRWDRALSYLGYVAEKARYGGSPRVIVDGLDALGITVRPFYLVREPAPEVDPTGAWPPGFEVRYLTEADMSALVHTPGRPYGVDDLVGRLRAGQRCLGVSRGGKVVAFGWCNLVECHFDGYRFRLGPDEAYLFDAYVDVGERGQGLAVQLRRHLCWDLRAEGRTRLYSVTDAFNVSARRFKERLGARPLLLAVWVDVFGVVRFTKVVKRYG